ncbi:hypothetical protein DASC09_041780 [Saccharomycopsis crataegensis]|uniref:Uncharacterized protein n=1 Tax=Saccharomycopsis crataegensis TaxID=43959 RepID=A0AAV5QRT1_9ASCO|nr:hypothetical protein DASC09_041780 [Saccharomycopsis crataegensis]
MIRIHRNLYVMRLITYLKSVFEYSKYDLSKLKKLELVDCINYFDGSCQNSANLQELKIILSSNYCYYNTTHNDSGSEIEIDRDTEAAHVDYHNTNKEKFSKVLNVKSLYFPKLKKLTLGNCGIQEMDIEKLSSLALSKVRIARKTFGFNLLGNSKELTVDNVKFQNSELSEIPSLEYLPKLKCLKFMNNYHIRMFENLQYLLPLTRSKTLENFPSLQILNLGNNHISSISNLSHPNLKELSKVRNPVSDFSSLSEFPALESLDLNWTGASSFEDLRSISSLKGLKNLFLLNTYIQDLEYFNFYGLPPSVKIENYYNSGLAKNFDMLFDGNDSLEIICNLGRGKKFSLFDKLLADGDELADSDELFDSD